MHNTLLAQSSARWSAKVHNDTIPEHLLGHRMGRNAVSVAWNQGLPSGSGPSPGRRERSLERGIPIASEPSAQTRAAQRSSMLMVSPRRSAKCASLLPCKCDLQSQAIKYPSGLPCEGRPAEARTFAANGTSRAWDSSSGPTRSLQRCRT